MTELNLLRGVFERANIEHPHGSVLWPLTALFLHSAIFVWFHFCAIYSLHFAYFISIFNFSFGFFFSHSNITSGLARFENGRRHPTDFNFLTSSFCTDFSTRGLSHDGGVWIELA